jgi:hypothetical protein
MTLCIPQDLVSHGRGGVGVYSGYLEHKLDDNLWNVTIMTR